jgi:hypothetical protein
MITVVGATQRWILHCVKDIAVDDSRSVPLDQLQAQSNWIRSVVNGERVYNPTAPA